MEQFTRKIGRNRGKPRLWIEGKHLNAAGLAHGTLWTLEQTDSGLIIKADPNGKRRIAGRQDRPIIDIVGAGLGKISQATTVTVSYVTGSGVMEVKETDNV